MKEITSEEFMTSKNTWDPTKLDVIGGASDLMISQFPPIPLDAIDSFYNDQGDICATKSDSKVDSKIGPAVVDSEVGPAVVENVNGTIQNLLMENTDQNLKRRKEINGNGSIARRLDRRTNHKHPAFQITYYKRMIHKSNEFNQ